MKKEEESAKKRKPKTSPAQLRVQKGTSTVSCAVIPVAPSVLKSHPADLTELELPKTMRTEFPDAADVLNFTLTIEPDEGRCFLSLSLLSEFLPTDLILLRHVQDRIICLYVCNQQQLST